MFARTLVLGVVKGLVSEEFVLCYGCESRRRSRNTFVGRNRRANFISAKLLLCNQLPILPSSLRRWIIGNQMNTEWLDLPWCSVLFQSICSTLVIRNRTEIHTQNKELRMIVTHKHLFEHKQKSTRTHKLCNDYDLYEASVGKDAVMACAQFVIVNNPDVGLSWNREHGNTISQSKNFPAHETKRH